jgi:hypothetical protein
MPLDMVDLDGLGEGIHPQDEKLQGDAGWGCEKDGHVTYWL